MMKRLSKEDRFDVIYNGLDFMDQKNLCLKELYNFLSDLEYMNGQKWTPIYLPKIHDYSKPYFFHTVYTYWLHGYIVCYHDEIEKDWFSGKLSSKGSILPEVLESDYLEEQERKRIEDANNRSRK